MQDVFAAIAEVVLGGAAGRYRQPALALLSPASCEKQCRPCSGVFFCTRCHSVSSFFLQVLLSFFVLVSWQLTFADLAGLWGARWLQFSPN